MYTENKLTLLNFRMFNSRFSRISCRNKLLLEKNCCQFNVQKAIKLNENWRSIFKQFQLRAEIITFNNFKTFDSSLLCKLKLTLMKLTKFRPRTEFLSFYNSRVMLEQCLYPVDKGTTANKNGHFNNLDQTLNFAHWSRLV